MISLPHLINYFKEEIDKSNGLIRNIFLTTCESTSFLI